MGPGVPKPLRRLGGCPLVAHVVERLRPQVMDLVIVANKSDSALRRLAPVIADPPDIRAVGRREGRRLGPLAGILAGMEWAQKHHPHAGWILTAPADLPFLPQDLTVRLCGHMHVPEPEVLAVRGEHALAVWSVRLASDLRRALLPPGTFFRIFLTLMIAHHKGALEMSQALLARSDQPSARAFAQAVVTSQQAEIDLMTTMLKARQAS